MMVGDGREDDGGKCDPTCPRCGTSNGAARISSPEWRFRKRTGYVPPTQRERMNSPQQPHDVHLRGLDGDAGSYSACHVEVFSATPRTLRSVIPREAPPRTIFPRGAVAPTEESAVRTARPDARPDLAVTGCGRAGAEDAAHPLAAESAQADFANFQRRIYSLLEGGMARTSEGEGGSSIGVSNVHRTPVYLASSSPAKADFAISRGEFIRSEGDARYRI
jgi:hypothetical protein